MSGKRSAILDLGEMLIRTRGYHAFSYHDISGPLAIRNAAVHYHFPTKANLGAAIIDRNMAQFGELTASWSHYPADDQFRLFTQIYLASRQQGWVCLMGALSPAWDTLPGPMQAKLRQMGEDILDWLTGCLQKGKAAGVFGFGEPTRQKAQLVVSCLLSSLLLGKVMGETLFQSIQEGVQESV